MRPLSRSPSRGLGQHLLAELANEVVPAHVGSHHVSDVLTDAHSVLGGGIAHHVMHGVSKTRDRDDAVSLVWLGHAHTMPVCI